MGRTRTAKALKDRLLLIGNKDRGEEIKSVLYMLGAKPDETQKYVNSGYCYYIGYDDRITVKAHIIEKGDTYTYHGYKFTVMTIEEFESKYPYKVGDVVAYKHDLVRNPHVIVGTEWKDGEVLYHLNDRGSYGYTGYKVDELLPYKESSVESPVGHDVAIPNCPICQEFKNDDRLVNIDLTRENCHDEVDIIFNDEFELKYECKGKIKLIRKRFEYPKTYEECCKVLGVSEGIYISNDLDNYLDFLKLMRCREAYRVLAKKDPKLANERDMYPIAVDGKTVMLLSFPSYEMAVKFHDNFKELISSCRNKGLI